MHMKFTFALSAALLCLTTSIRARPIQGSRELVEREPFKMEERSIVDTGNADVYLTSRDTFEDPLSDLVARGRKRKTAGSTSTAPKKPRKKRVKKAPGAPRSDKAPPVKTPPAPGLKGAAMNAHVQNLRAQKLAAKNNQRGGAPQSARKAAKNQQRKDFRTEQKLQKWRNGPIAAKTHKISMDGKLIEAHLPMKPNDRAALTATKKANQATRKAAGKAKWDAMTPDQQKARTDKQAADRATHATAKAARLATKKADRDTARTAKKAQMQGVRTQFDASIAGGSFPERDVKFNTAKEGQYKGRDVRQALFNGYAAAAKGGVGHKKNGASVPPHSKHPKNFDNRPNSDGNLPIPGMTGGGREFGMTKNSVIGYTGLQPNPTATRLITQDNGHGVQQFGGVVSHPVSSGPTDPAHNDHVQVPGTP